MSEKIVFLLGSEEGEKQAYIDSEKAELKKQYSDLEVTTFFAFETDAAQLEEALFGSSLFSSYTLVILKHFEAARKDSPLNKVILRFAKEEGTMASLIVVSSETTYSLSATLTKALPKEAFKVFWEMFENKKQDWLRTFFKKEGYSINNEAIRYILDMIENNTMEMKNVASQLIIFFNVNKKKEKTVTLDDIASYLSHTKSEDGFSLFAQVAKTDLERSLGVLRKILNSDPRSGIGLVSILTRQFRLLESYMMNLATMSQEDALKNAEALTSSPALAKGINGFRDKQLFAQAAKNYSLSEVSDIILYLEKMDTEVKLAASDGLSLTLELMLYTIIVGKGKTTKLQLQRELLDNSLRYREGN